MAVLQGAEAKLYLGGDFYGRPCIIKERFQKNYRHPILDKALTSQRIKSEVRANLRCRIAGIQTPTIFMVNFDTNSIYMEEIQDAVTVRQHINTVQAAELNPASACSQLKPLAEAIGRTLAKMHTSNIIHGDLTTSNMLLEGDPSELSLFLIDFGLSSFEASAEDKGVDLYVLERAFLSSHPNSQELFDCILAAYTDQTQDKNACKEVISKLDEVRLRGRKRTMVG
ncbi:Ekc/keops complex subunit bud32 [Plakobranchus ocellatus]|uniref:non-specific serine/threonine protein kinase n=1 Tax=Plakobranchus ocellatus TaxID=259542 RepID=A0AAV4CHS3_9GAST|nr:Ekc/keops complex subunit bud32 [Plakobranchus ocellatus]